MEVANSLIRLHVNDSISYLDKERLNIIIIPDLNPTSVIVHGSPDDKCFSCNIFVQHGQNTSIQEIGNDLPIGLTESYLNYLKAVRAINQIVLLDPIGVDPKGFDKIYLFLQENLKSYSAVALFIRFRFLSRTFKLVDGECLHLLDRQVTLKNDEEEFTFKVRNSDG